MYSYAHNQEMSQEIPPKLPKSLEFDVAGARAIIGKVLEDEGTLLTEAESKALLKGYGIPVNRTEVATSQEEAVRIAQEVGYPVVMKIHSRDIIHKSDAGGVQLNLRNDEGVEIAFEKIMTSANAYDPNARILGVTIQPMLECADYELIVGTKKDADFGPVILFGMGGIMTEILKDRAIALPPLNRLLARRLMEGTRVYRILQGYRNRPAANLELLEEILIRLAQLVTDFPEIEELDINPMILMGDQDLAVDARVIVKPSKVQSPHHLVISPYPNQYEAIARTKGGLELLIRPIKPEDAPLLVDLFHSLSERSVYYRFFSPLKSLPPEMLARFTQLDYDRDMALVAFDQTQLAEKMLGVARYVGHPGGESGEIAVAVGDAWHGKGVGATLLKRLLMIAKERGMASLGGPVLEENTDMLALAKKLGFSVSRLPGERAYQIKMDLKTMSTP